MEENTLRNNAHEKQPSGKDEKICDSQQRVCKILSCLAGHEDRGLSLTQISEKTGIPKVKAYRDLFNLVVAGFVEKNGESYTTGKAVFRMFDFYSTSLKQRAQAITRELVEILDR